MKKRKLIVPIEFNHTFGGMQKSVATLLYGLKNIYEIIIIIPKGGDAKCFYNSYDLNTVELGEEKNWRLRNWRVLFNVIKLRRIVGKYIDDEDIILTNNFTSELIFGLLNNKNRVFISRGGEFRGLRRKILNLSLKTANEVIAISSKQANVIHRQFGIDAHVINNPIAEYEVKERFSKNKIIANIGHFCERKNQILLLYALKKLINLKYDFKVYFYGNSTTDSDYIYEKKIKCLVKDLDLEDYVFFKGYVSSIEKIYNNVDIVVSTALEEGFGRTIAEAMFFKRPVIALECAGGPKDIIQHGRTGWLINNSEDDMVAAIIEASYNSTNSPIVTAAYEYAVEKFAIKNIAKQYHRIFESIK